jgi:hypothetical protein
MDGIGTLISDPAGTIEAIVAEKYKLWSDVLSGNGTDDQKYAVGKEIGNLLFGVLSGAAISKLKEIIRVAKTEKSMIKAAKAADEATGVGTPQGRGSKIHSKFEKTNKSNGIKSEISYKDGKLVRRGEKGSVRADATYGKNPKKPKIAYDLKTGKSGISPQEAAKYRKHMPKSTKKLKEISKDANGNYRVKRVKW